MGMFSYILGLSAKTMELLYSKAVVIIIMLLLGFILGKLTGKVIKKLLYEISLNRIIKIFFGIRIKADTIVSGIVSFSIYFVSIIYALDKLGLEKAVVSIVVWGTLFIIFVSFILGIKDFVPNLFAGMVIIRRNYFNDNDIISINGIKGKVIDRGILETHIKTEKGDDIYIPNSFILKGKLTRHAKEN